MTRRRLGWRATDAETGDAYVEGLDRQFTELAEERTFSYLQLCEIDEDTGTITRDVVRVQIPDGKLPIFFRRSKLLLTSPQITNERVTCIGYRDKETGDGSYVFVRPDGQIIMTNDAWGVVPN